MAPAHAVDLSAWAGVSTDYRDRGRSTSQKDPSVQAEVTADFSPSLYAGVFAASQKGPGLGSAELAGFAGWGGESGLWQYGVGVLLTAYPTGPRSEEAAVYANLAWDAGIVRAELKGEYGFEAFDQPGDNGYIQGIVEAALPGQPLRLVAHVGHESGAYQGNKVDWAIGLRLDQAAFEFSLDYVDTNRPDQDMSAGGIFRVRMFF